VEEYNENKKALISWKKFWSSDSQVAIRDRTLHKSTGKRETLSHSSASESNHVLAIIFIFLFTPERITWQFAAYVCYYICWSQWWSKQHKHAFLGLQHVGIKLRNQKPKALI